MTYLKTLALLLLALNAGLWFGSDWLRPEGLVERGSGRLPRVADLQVAGPEKEATVPVPPPVEERPEFPVRPAVEPLKSLKPVEAPPLPQSDEVPASAACVQLGWFESDQEAAQARARDPRIPEAARVVEVSVPLPPFHWVLLPPAESREAAYESFRELRARGIDAYLVMEGPQENAVSLGLFESRRAAENVLSQRQSQGLEAILASFPRNQIRYALFFEAPAEGPENGQAAMLEGLESEFESVVKSRCEGVATPQKNP